MLGGDDGAADASAPGDSSTFPSGDDDSGSVAFMQVDGGSGPRIVDGSVALPANFMATDKGGYALGASIEGAGEDAGIPENTGSANCSLNPLDLFQAERMPSGSHFRADTNLAFTSCGTIPPDIPK